MPPARLEWICPVAAYLCLTDGTGIGQRRPSIEDAACVGLASHGPRPLGTAQPKGSESSALQKGTGQVEFPFFGLGFLGQKRFLKGFTSGLLSWEA